MTPSFIGYHYDIARGAYLLPATFQEAIRHVARNGFTHFVPYLENMIRLPSLSRACPPCAYTPDDWRQFEAVAKEAGIELVPHFNVIGHTENICPAYPELGGEADRGQMALDPERPATQEWTLRCLAEFCEFSHSEYFLIGGDEWQPPSHLLARSDCDVARLWADQVNRAVEFLASQGRQPIVWHDMLLHHPRTLELLSRRAVVAFWFYDFDSDYPVLDMLKARGFQTIMASGMNAGLLSARDVRAARCALQAARTHRADGFLMTSWEDARWETQKSAIELVGKLLRAEPLPEAIIEANSLMDTWRRLPTDHLRQRLQKLLGDPAWQHHPELHRLFSARIANDAHAERELFARSQYAVGPTYERIGTRSPTTPVPPAFAGPAAAGQSLCSGA